MCLGTAASAQTQDGDKRAVPDGTVRFETGSSRITEASKKALDRIAEYIQSQPVADILVVGHTDRHGGKATNERLSKSRARKVRNELKKRKVPGDRISVTGVGSAEPISTARTKEADSVNRRVEVWVGTREAIAWISWIYRTVEAQKPAAKGWDQAKLKMELRRLFRVRTQGRSAGEITFSEGKTLFLGPESLVVVYGKDTKKRRKRKVADVTIEQGSLLARLGEEPAIVDTDEGRFFVKSNRTRIDSSDDKARSTIAVYDGEASAYAKGKSVPVASGYGTRVKRGEAPEPATPLPPPPTWDSRDPIVGFARRPITVRWLPAIDHPGAFVEIGGIDDPSVERPLESRTVEGTSLAVGDLPPGAYRVRVSSMDERDLIGLPSQGRELIILPSPEAVRGDLTWTGKGWNLSEPGPVRLPDARGAKAEWTNPAGDVEPSVIEVGPGTRRLKVQLTNGSGRTVAEGDTSVTVRPLSVRLVAVESSVPTEDGDEVTFLVEAADTSGLPADDLTFATGDPDVGLLETPVDDSTWMLPLTAPRTATTTFSSIGEGRYRVKWKGPKQLGSAARYVLVYDPVRNIGQHVLLPVVGELEPPTLDESGQPRLRIEHGLHFGANGGFEVARGDIHPGFRAEIGWTIVAANVVRLSLGIETGYTRASMQAGTVEMFPLFGRASVGFLVGPMRPYLGFAGGVRFLNGDLDAASSNVELEAPKEAVEGFIGLGAHYRGLEVFVEGRYGPTRAARAPGFGDVGEPGVYFGLRYFLEKG